MEKTWGQQVAFAFAIASVVIGTGCTVAAGLIHRGISYDPIRASLIASVFFFYSCAVVLYVIARTRLKGLLSLQR